MCLAATMSPQPNPQTAPEQLQLPLAHEDAIAPTAPTTPAATTDAIVPTAGDAPNSTSALKALATSTKRLPREICSSVGSDFAPPDPLTYIQIALDSLNQSVPLILNATRQPSVGEWNGWVIWGGTEPPDASFEFKALKVVNALERYPQLMPYLALATGYSLSLSTELAEIFPPTKHGAKVEPSVDSDLAPQLSAYPLRSPISNATKLFFLASALLHIAAIIFIGVSDPNATKGAESRTGRASLAGLSVRLNPLANPQAAPGSANAIARGASSSTSAKAAPNAATATASAATAATSSTTAPTAPDPTPAALQPIPTPDIAITPMREAPLLVEPIQAIAAPNTAVTAMRDQPLIDSPIAPLAPPNTTIAKLRDAPIFTTTIAAVPPLSTSITPMRDAPLLTTPINPLVSPSTAVAAMRDAPILAAPLSTLSAPNTAVATMRDAPILARSIPAITTTSTAITAMREAPILNTAIAPMAPPSTAIAPMHDLPILTAPIPAISAAAVAASTAIAPMRDAPLIANPITPMAAPKLSQQLTPAPVFAPTPAATAQTTTAVTATTAATTTPQTTSATAATIATNASIAPSATAAAPSTAISSAAVDNMFGTPSTDTKSRAGDTPKASVTTAASPSAAGNLPLDAEAIRQRMRDAARNKETGEFLAATEKRSAFALALAPKIVRKTKEELAIEQAWKPDCRTAYKDSPLGLAAIGPLIWGAVSENAKCKW